MGFVTALQYGVLSIYNVTEVTLRRRAFPLFRLLLELPYGVFFALSGDLAAEQNGRKLFLLFL